MKIIISTLSGILLALSSATFAENYVNDYPRADGKYIKDHYKPRPNKYRYDKYGPKANKNPYINKRGTKRYAKKKLPALDKGLGNNNLGKKRKKNKKLLLKE